jgi:hypothetical protein
MKASEAIVIPIFIVPAAGSPGWAKPGKPQYPQQPRRDEPRRDQAIPVLDKDRLRRDVETFRRATQPQVDAVVAAGRALLSP